MRTTTPRKSMWRPEAPPVVGTPVEVFRQPVRKETQSCRWLALLQGNYLGDCSGPSADGGWSRQLLRRLWPQL